MTPSKPQTAVKRTTMNSVHSNYNRIKNGFIDTFSSSEDDEDDDYGDFNLLTNSDYSNDSSNSSDNEAKDPHVFKIMAANGWTKRSNPGVNNLNGKVGDKITGKNWKPVHENGHDYKKKIRFAGESKDNPYYSEDSKEKKANVHKKSTTITIRRVGIKADGNVGNGQVGYRPIQNITNSNQVQKHFYLKGSNPVTTIRIRSVKKTDSPEGKVANSPQKYVASDRVIANKAVFFDKENSPKQEYWNQISENDNEMESNRNNVLGETERNSNENVGVQFVDDFRPRACLERQHCIGETVQSSSGSSFEDINKRLDNKGLGVGEYSSTLRQTSERMFGLIGRKIPAKTDTWGSKNVTYEVKYVQQKRVLVNAVDDAARIPASLPLKSKEHEAGASILDDNNNCNSDIEEWPEPPSAAELCSKSCETDADQPREIESQNEVVAGDSHQDQNVFVVPEQEISRDMQNLDDDSCILCDILSNEKRLARRSADMESFRQSTLHDCDKVLKKMEKAQTIVRKLSGNGSSLKAAARKSFTEKNSVLNSGGSSDENNNAKLYVAGQQTISTLGSRENVNTNGETGCRGDSPREALERETTVLLRDKRGGELSQPRVRNEANGAPRIAKAASQRKEHATETGHLYDEVESKRDETKSSKQSAQGVKFEEDVHAAARRHCKGIIDAGGYLIPQPKKTKDRPKAKRNLSEDFLIVDTMPSLQTVEPWGKKAAPQSNQHEGQGFNHSSFQSNSLQRNSNSFIHHKDINPKGLVNSASPNDVKFGRQSVRFQSPSSQVLRYHSHGAEANSAPPDTSRAEREKSWLKKAARRLRRSLSFEEKSHQNDSRAHPLQKTDYQQRRSSGNLVADFESSKQEPHERFYVEEGSRKHFGFQSLRRSKKDSSLTEDGLSYRNDPHFHPKYGFASGEVGNRTALLSTTGEDDVFIENGANLKGVYRNGLEKNGASTSSGFGAITRVPESSSYGGQANSNMSHPGPRQNGTIPHDDEWFIAPLEVRSPTKRTASTKRIQQRR
ncbi:uncharacterized protein LOC135688787 [Rhopilema esculentum]|uniref:uncharacterized protein LOC135688787 n=1 Tax=Rhopilema esculentum TaxID=499914 RepID=UPI0031D0C134|eukprot:gene7476-13250_t